MLKNLNIDDALDLLGRNYIGRLSYIYGKSPFILPITYYHDPEEKCIISYSAEGHNLEAMRNYDIVSLQVDDIKSVQSWKSVMVQGKFQEVTGSEAKYYLHKFANGVRTAMLMRGEEVPLFIKEFSSKLDDRGLPVVYRITITEIIGKYRDDDK